MLNIDNKGRLKLTVEQLIRYNQQVVVKIKHKGEKRYLETGSLVHIVNGKDNKEQLGVRIQRDSYSRVIDGESIVRKISVKDITHIDIVQTYSGGACTLILAEALLGLKIRDIHEGYISQDDIDDNPAITTALETFKDKLVKRNVKHTYDLKGGSFSIKVKIKE